MLGTSGQPVHDIACYSNLSDPLNILQHTLEWAHIAPTCPDTLCELVCCTGVMFIKVKFLLVVTLIFVASYKILLAVNIHIVFFWAMILCS